MQTNDKTPSMRHKARALSLTLLRAVVGIVMMAHGWMKLTDIAGTTNNFAAMGIPMPEISAHLAVAGELLGGAGLFVGLLTPIAAAGVLSTMLVAITVVHWDGGLLMKNNGFEYPLTLAALAVYFMMRGAGPLSLDAWWAKRRSEEDAERSFTVPGQHPSSVEA